MWQQIIYELQYSTKEIQTVPLSGHGKWFLAYSDGHDIFVKSSKDNQPSCKISSTRKLDKEHFEGILEIYRKRCKGKAVSTEATKLTRNQVYWYGIFSALNIK